MGSGNAGDVNMMDVIRDPEQGNVSFTITEAQVNFNFGLLDDQYRWFDRILEPHRYLGSEFVPSLSWGKYISHTFVEVVFMCVLQLN